MKLLGLAVALGASVGLVLAGRGEGGGGAALVGNLLMVVTALSYGFAPLFSKTALKGIEPVETMAVTMTVGSAILLGISLGAGESFSWVTTMPYQGWLLLGGLGLLPCFFAQILWYIVLRRQEASKIVVFTYLIPLVSLALSFAWLGERPALISLVLGASVIAGVGLVQWQPRRRTP
jgi:drug/metabolite transporter (DMT)-like permease